MYPKTYKKLVASKLSKNFRAAVEIVTVDWISPSSNEVVIRNLFAGVRACLRTRYPRKGVLGETN